MPHGLVIESGMVTTTSSFPRRPAAVIDRYDRVVALARKLQELAASR